MHFSSLFLVITTIVIVIFTICSHITIIHAQETNRNGEDITDKGGKTEASLLSDAASPNTNKNNNNNNNNDDPVQKLDLNRRADFDWLHFDCQVCSALCSELDNCVKATHIDHEHDEIVQCAINNLTDNYGMENEYLRRRSEGAEGRREKLSEEKRDAVKQRQESDRADPEHRYSSSPSTSNSNSNSNKLSKANSKIRDKIVKSLETHMDIYHQEVVLHALVASGKSRQTRHQVPHPICLELLCHEHLHICHEDEAPPLRHHDIDKHVDQLLEAEKQKQEQQTKSKSNSNINIDDNAEDSTEGDDDSDESPSTSHEVHPLLRTHHEKDDKFSTHNDHHHHFKDSFNHFVHHFEDKHFGGGLNSGGRLSSQKRSHLGGGGRHIFPHKRRHAAFIKTPDEQREEDMERVMRTTRVNNDEEQEGSSDL